VYDLPGIIKKLYFVENLVVLLKNNSFVHIVFPYLCKKYQFNGGEI